MKKVLLVDFNPLYYRSYHSLKKHELKNSKGELTFASYGFFKSLLSWIKKLKPEVVIVCDDSTSFRKDLDSNYKSNRTIKCDGEMFNQKQKIVEGLSALKIPIIKKEGMEADDLIATLTLTKEWSFDLMELEDPYTETSSEMDFHVLTIDYDLLQLVRHNVTVHMFKTLSSTESFTPSYLIKSKNVPPVKWSMYKVIVGDNSDGLKGVKGIGPKKALEIISYYDSLREGISDEWSRIKNERLRNLMIQNKETLIMNHQLMDLSFDEKTRIAIKEIENEMNFNEFFISQMEFRSMEKDLKNLEVLSAECSII